MAKLTRQISADPAKPLMAGAEGMGIKPNKATTSAGSGTPYAERHYTKQAQADLYGPSGPASAAPSGPLPKLRRKP